jgi:predicted Zn-dependent protease
MVIVAALAMPSQSTWAAGARAGSAKPVKRSRAGKATAAAPVEAAARGSVAGHISDGDGAILMNDLDGARKAYEAALQLAPGDVTATVRLAFVEHRTGHDSRALELLSPLTAAREAPTEALMMLGSIHAASGAWALARQAYAAVVERAPADVGARLVLARALGKMAESGDAGLKREAISQYERVVALLDDDPALRSSAQEELFGVKYGASGRAFLEARTAYASGDYRGAVSKLEKVCKEHPEIEEAEYLLGMAYITPDVNRRPDAIAAWQKAPSMKEAHLHLATEWQSDGDLARATKECESAIALDKTYQEAWYQRGVIAAEQGDERAAVSAWGQAVRLDPDSETGKWAATKVAMITAAGASGGVFQEGQIIDPASETAMGQKFEDMALAELGGVIHDDKLTLRMNRIWDRLVAASDRGDIPYKLYLVDSDILNAFTSPGGRIFVTRALLDAIRTRMGDRDETYAAVMGHELAHAALRHMPEKWKYVQTVINDPSADQDTKHRALLSVVTGMTRMSEFEADQYGALYMYRAGYNPRFAIELHARFRATFGEIPPGLDHPPFAEREARLRDFVIEMRGRVREFERGNKKLAAGDYAGAARSYEIFLAVLPRSAPGHLNLGLARHRQALARLGTDQKYKRSTDLDPDSRAAPIELHSAGRAAPDPRVDHMLLREAAAEYRMALRLDPHYTLARIDYGALLMDLGDSKDATTVLERATRDAPRSGLAWNNLGIAYAMAGKDKQALAALEAAANADARLADPWFNMGVVHADAGRNDQARKAWETYARLDGKTGWSRKAIARKGQLK